MAGPAPDFSILNSSLFNIYNDGQLGRSSPSLPGGPCNYVDLSHGANGPKCGCRRFWSRGTDAASPTGFPQGYPKSVNGSGPPSPMEQGHYCMCSHHACFHDDVGTPQAGPAQFQALTTAGQENERPRTNREPLTPVLPDLSFQMPPPPTAGGHSMDFQTFNAAGDSFAAAMPDLAGVPQGHAPTLGPNPSIPDTLSWTNFLQSQQQGPDGGSLPPIPSQCLLPSQPSSTTSSTRMAYMRPFAGRGLQTLSGVKSKLCEPAEIQDENISANQELVPDPSVEPSVDGNQTVTNTPRSARRTKNAERQSQASPSPFQKEEFRHLSNTVQGHEQRIDRLENMSFSVGGHEECHDKLEHADIRVTELESRVEEVEKLLNDSASHASNHHRLQHRDIDESASSVVSDSTASTASIKTPGRAELYSELQSLREQLSHLQGLSSFPSYSKPWEVEVVFLPFPLKAVWMAASDFPSQRQSGSSVGNVDNDQWTQLPASSSVFEPTSPGGLSEFQGPDSESDWLLARACAPDRMIDRRLRSRGLVKNVVVRGSDARSVNQAIGTAFGTLFRTFSRMQANVHHGSTTHQRVNRFLGLHQPWVPLRKVHKDSRLRFLSPAEMVTPAMWDVPFLSSSVVMKATGVHRLFITQPEAYIQDQDAYDNGWDWHRLRELSRVYPDSQSSQLDVPEADAMEDCWTWNAKLDETQDSFHGGSSLSLSLRQAAQPRFRSTSRSSSAQYYTGNSFLSPSVRGTSPLVLKERKASISTGPEGSMRPPHVRTTSMPPSLAPLASPSLVKRRVTSYTQSRPYDRRASPQVGRAGSVGAVAHAHALSLAARRRATRSPGIRSRATPRWSTASASPGPEVFPGAVSSIAPKASGRQPTPRYYDTPFSNAPLAEPRPSRAVAGPAADDEDDDDGDIDLGGRGSGTDSGNTVDIHIDEDNEDDDDDEDYDDGQNGARYEDSPMIDLFQQHGQDSSEWHGVHGHQALRPEDEPWKGIEDAENMDPESTFDIDIHVDEDAMSDMDEDDHSGASSVPSEYPSTQTAWKANEGREQSAPLSVFVDDDAR